MGYIRVGTPASDDMAAPSFKSFTRTAPESEPEIPSAEPNSFHMRGHGFVGVTFSERDPAWVRSRLSTPCSTHPLFLAAVSLLCVQTYTNTSLL